MSARSAAREGAHRVAHLTTRFVTSVRPRPVDRATLAWVASRLEPAELRVWEGMGRADRAESVAVGRRLEVALAGREEATDTRWSAAALAHDVGKQRSSYGITGRVIVTALATVMGQTRLRAWAASANPIRARAGRYVAHDDLGAALLRDAGARPEVAAWAGAHHRAEQWASTGIPPAVCRALAAADGEARTN